MDTKYIFVTGGVCSGLGKGIATASLGAILKAAGYRVSILKMDPYINVDPGTMSPFEHGEVFVTDDGYEADLDLGHYERFIDTPLSRLSNITTGQLYQKVIEAERHGVYLGKTIQVIPQITSQIKERMREIAAESRADFIIIEIGGTVGDIEGEPYLEAARQFHREMGSGRVMFVLLTLLPYLTTSAELKTKPTQMAVRELHRVGIQPDMILARSDYEIASELREKIASFCDVSKESVIPAMTIRSIYEVPLALERHGISSLVFRHFGMEERVPDLEPWCALVARIEREERKVSVGVVGKYVGGGDAYISVHESLKNAAAHHGVAVEIVSIDAEKLEAGDVDAQEMLGRVDGVVVPGGFGHRGVEGKIRAARYAREEKVPYLGLCLGMQVMAIELGRVALDSDSVHSTEFDQATSHDLIHILPEQRTVMADGRYGASMRLGAYACEVAEGTKAYRAYTSGLVHAVPMEQLATSVRISERHRHRYEFNNTYRDRLVTHGMIVSGINPDKHLVEIIELRDHPFMVGVQFHPEFQSRPLRPHPLFYDFIGVCVRGRE